MNPNQPIKSFVYLTVLITAVANLFLLQVTTGYYRVTTGYYRVTTGLLQVTTGLLQGYYRLLQGYYRVTTGYYRLLQGYYRVTTGYYRFTTIRKAKSFIADENLKELVLFVTFSYAGFVLHELHCLILYPAVIVLYCILLSVGPWVLCYRRSAVCRTLCITLQTFRCL